MDSTLALGAFRIARGAGGEGVDVNGNLVEREKHRLNLHLYLHLYLGAGCAQKCWPIFGFRNVLGARRGSRGQFSGESELADFLAEGRRGEAPQGGAASWVGAAGA